MAFPIRFPGGVHPNEIGNGKASTSGKPVVAAKPPDRVIIPLSQHIGAPCECAVTVGQRVYKGQLIGQARAVVSAPVHAPVSGTVVNITPCFLANGLSMPSVIIDNDFKETWDPAIAPPDDYRTMTPKEIAEYIRKAGIVGMGGATFPTAVKLLPPPGKTIDTVIVNGVECEPYLTADHRLLLEGSEQVLEGLHIILHTLGAKNAYIGIEQNKPDAIARMREVTSGTAIRVVDLPVKYPQGSEKQLIYAITGRRVPKGGLPMDIGAVVMNVATVSQIAHAFITGEPLIERIVTVAGKVKSPQNLLVRVGTPLINLIEQCGGMEEGVRKVILGGPMMGTAISRLDVPVVKGTSGVLALGGEAVSPPESPCIRCGRCATVCPMRLLPMHITAYINKRAWGDAEKAGVMECMECGACTYGCPAKRELTQTCRVGKKMILAGRKKA